MENLWYLYWIDVRKRVLFSAIWLVLFSVIFAVANGGTSRRYLQSGQLAGEFRNMASAFDRSRMGDSITLASHVLPLPWETLVAALILSGNGLRAKADRNSAQLRLSLPVTRRRLIAGRLVFGVAALALFMALVWAANVAIAWVEGTSLPAWPMALSSVAMTLLILPIVAGQGIANLHFNEQWAAVIVTALVLIAGNTLARFTGRLLIFSTAQLPWDILGAGLVAAAGLTIALFWLGGRKEF
jgi:hypothetical protein